MLNLRLNLLSPYKINKIENLAHFIFIKGILEMVIFVCSLLSISLLWSWLVLQEDFTNIATTASTVNKEYATYNQEIRLVNQTMREVDLASNNYSAITPRLKEIADSLPGNIKLSSLQIDRLNKSISIEGTALTRDDLLKYQETLKNIAWIGQVDTPISKLLQKENINFSFTKKIK